ncbi:WxL domain-containing protein [Vagococcus sp. BWB3-3]|uniref:WxL domain-containing protein n=1 Tax=Vagococcus allomyrinae TaxID=2794353 RepID=A0A940ST98_9ENTE|nr:WxL domain-containing protein [Vagococcus allomyrinae]MBP1040080.1 WxL domain-containing protein [Vagococcus allomyrinae]
MKKSILAAGICALVLAGGYTANAAEETTSLNTEGKVQFSPEGDDSTGEVHTPNEDGEEGEDPEVIELPGQGNGGTGALRIQFVPNLFFKTEESKAARSVSNVNVLKYNLKGEAAESDIAPFVQVSDGRGLTGEAAKWDLTVKATPFTATGADLPGGTHVLTNSTIVFGGSTLTSDYMTSAKAAERITGQEDLAKTGLATNGTASVSVMKTQAGKDTNGYQVSNVFHDGYEKGATTYADGNTAGVQFVKPAGIAPYTGVDYTSTLTWTLTSGI